MGLLVCISAAPKACTNLVQADWASGNGKPDIYRLSARQIAPAPERNNLKYNRDKYFRKTRWRGGGNSVLALETWERNSSLPINHQHRMTGWQEDGKARPWKARCRNSKKETALGKRGN
jgi:hypothetical protein